MATQPRLSKKELLVTVSLKRDLTGAEQVAIILTGQGPAGVWAYCDCDNSQHNAPKDIVEDVQIGLKVITPPPPKKAGTKN